jgi:hypothetical protein
MHVRSPGDRLAAITTNRPTSFCVRPLAGTGHEQIGG